MRIYSNNSLDFIPIIIGLLLKLVGPFFLVEIPRKLSGFKGGRFWNHYFKGDGFKG